MGSFSNQDNWFTEFGFLFGPSTARDNDLPLEAAALAQSCPLTLTRLYGLHRVKAVESTKGDALLLGSQKSGPSTMDHNDIVLSLHRAVLAGGGGHGQLACLGLIKNEKKDDKSQFKLDTGDVDTIALTATITFIAMMVARHPEWFS